MKNSTWDNIFLGFFVLTVICGIYLIIQKDYISGIAGSITGLFLIYLQKTDQKKNKNSK